LVLGISSLALMPQHGEPVSTGSEFGDALWVAKDKGLLKLDVSDAFTLLEIADIGDVRAVDIKTGCLGSPLVVRFFLRYRNNTKIGGTTTGTMTMTMMTMMMMMMTMIATGAVLSWVARNLLVCR